MIPKKLVPDLIGDGNRLSDKIMREQYVGDAGMIQSNLLL
jgi:hypothetical protein